LLGTESIHEPSLQKPLSDPTGIDGIDSARALIANSNWKQALHQLDSLPEHESKQIDGLVNLYRAVIFSESGLGTEEQATELFQQSISQLATASSGDRFRAHNNFANFLLNKVQDRLHNHAFQIATGGDRPIASALLNWIEARKQYQLAGKNAQADNSNRQATVSVNLARLYALLSDLIVTLDYSEGGSRQFEVGSEAAAVRAEMLLTDVSASKTASSMDPLLLAAAEEIQASLAFRKRESDACLVPSNAALHAYLDAGSLTGAEGIHRLLGLHYMQALQFEEPKKSDAELKAQALKHFLISHELSQFFRDRIPHDQIGRNQAGFFARRSYVNEKIVELLIAEGRPAEALQYAELAKARSLQDLLSVDRVAIGDMDNHEAKSFQDILQDWPNQIAAIEYFLGSEKAWIFLVDTSGKVHAFDLLAPDKKSRDLILEVRQFLDNTDSYAGSMKKRLLSGKGYDHSWQLTLHQLFKTLIPEEVLVHLQQAKTVVVVPHHVLHYFPFAALVTAIDERERGNYEMVQPQFLVDETFNLVHAPSLEVWDLLRSRPEQGFTKVGAVGIVDIPGELELPGVKKDVDNLQAAFAGSLDEIAFGDRATETNILPMLARPGMLLIATHGMNLADSPLSSFLMFLPDTIQDGRLTARELFSTTVNSDLIVMSACYSGLAERSPLPGDDLFGIQRALLQSGARTVVSGLWDVYDGTAPELNKEFFARLAQGNAVPEALAQSQRSFLNVRRSTADDPFVHPYFWAVYTVAGDDRTAFGKQ
jgi:CHAT domain-containing protein